MLQLFAFLSAATTFAEAAAKPPRLWVLRPHVATSTMQYHVMLGCVPDVPNYSSDRKDLMPLTRSKAFETRSLAPSKWESTTMQISRGGLCCFRRSSKSLAFSASSTAVVGHEYTKLTLVDCECAS